MKKRILSVLLPVLNIVIFGALLVLLLLSNNTISPTILTAIICCVLGGFVPLYIIIKCKIEMSELFLYCLKALGVYLLISFISAVVAFISLSLYLIILLLLFIYAIIFFWNVSNEPIKRFILIMTNPVMYVSIMSIASIIEINVLGLKF